MGDKLDELDWQSLETRREQSYLALAPNVRKTGASHESQYTRYLPYSDALKKYFFPRAIPMWNSLPSSVVSSKTTYLPYSDTLKNYFFRRAFPMWNSLHSSMVSSKTTDELNALIKIAAWYRGLCSSMPLPSLL